MVTATRLYPLGDYYINGSLDEVSGYNSYAFNGVNNNISITSGNLDLSTGAPNWTIETWFNSATIASQQVIISKDLTQGTTNGSYVIQLFSSPFQLFYGVGDGLSVGGYQLSYQYLVTLSSGVWYHVAMTRYGSNVYSFFNGNLVNTGVLTNVMVDGGQPLKIGTNQNNLSPFNGNIFKTRIVKGNALYTSNFTPSLSPLLNISNTVLLTSQTPYFADEINNTLIINGPPTISNNIPYNFATSIYPNTIFTAFNNKGIDEISISNTYQQTAYFDGATSVLSFTPNYNNEPVFSTVNAYLLEVFFNSNVAFNTSAGSWTTGLVPLFGRKAGSPGAAANRMVVSVGNTVTLRVDRAGYSSRYYTIPPLTTNTWYHLAFVRNANNDATAFLNGQRVSAISTTAGGASLGQYFNDVTVYGNGPSAVGFDADTVASVMFKGYMTNARIIANASIYNVYSNTIPIPTLPLNVFANTGILANTVLLALQTNLGTANTKDFSGTTLIPNGTFTYTFTAPTITNFASQRIDNTGNMQVVGQFDEIGVVNIINSNYFPQASTNQVLILPYTLGSNLDFLTTTNNWTVECWFNCLYNTSVSDGRNTIFAKDSSAGSTKYTSGIWLEVGSVGSGAANTLTLHVGNSTSSTVTSCYSQQVIAANTWYHVAATRDGANVNLYLNGSLTNTAVVGTTNIGYGSLPYQIGQNANGAISSEVFAGYISNFRIINGITQYKSNFNPLFPLVSVPNTVLLTCQSSTIKDNSPQNFTITSTNVSVNTYAPSISGVFTSSLLSLQ